MKKINIKTLNIITAFVLCLIAAICTSICFLHGDIALKTDGKSYAPIYNGDRNSAKVAVMINVYEGADVVDGMLAVLRDNNAKATFFVGGCWADDNADLLVKILEEGHRQSRLFSSRSCQIKRIAKQRGNGCQRRSDSQADRI